MTMEIGFCRDATGGGPLLLHQSLNGRKFFFESYIDRRQKNILLSSSARAAEPAPAGDQTDEHPSPHPSSETSDRDGHVRIGNAGALLALCPEQASELASLTSVSKGPVMLQSHVIDVDGAFVGAAVRLDNGYRFIATDMKLDDLDGSIWPTLADVQRLARRIYLGGRIDYPAHERATA